MRVGDRLGPESEDGAGVAVEREQLVSPFEVVPEAAVVLEPPEPRPREDDERGSLAPQPLELLDRLGAGRRVVPEVLAARSLREVAGRPPDVEERRGRRG